LVVDLGGITAVLVDASVCIDTGALLKVKCVLFVQSHDQGLAHKTLNPKGTERNHKFAVFCVEHGALLVDLHVRNSGNQLVFHDRKVLLRRDPKPLLLASDLVDAQAHDAALVQG
jgi:hypothetical protein